MLARRGTETGEEAGEETEVPLEDPGEEGFMIGLLRAKLAVVIGVYEEI